MQFEAAWALTNVASTDQTKLLLENGAVPPLVALLASPTANVRDQCAWCLGNIAGESALFRDVVLNHGAISGVVANILQPASISLLRNCAWTLSNFCRGKPLPNMALIASAYPAFKYLFFNQNDSESLADATWATSYLTDGGDDRIATVIDIGIIPILVNMLRSEKQALIMPALRTLGNIVTGINICVVIQFYESNFI